MSEPIIIKTPQPVTEERLVLVPPGTVSPTYGERGTVLTIHTDDARDATPDDLERAGWVPSVGDGSFAAVCDVIQRAHRVMHTEPGSDLVRECARVWREGREAVERAEKAERERDDLLARINQAEHEARCRGAEAKELVRVLEVERDEAKRLHSEAEAQVACRSELRAQVASLRAELARLTAPAEGSCWACREELGVAHERARQQPEKGRATDEELVDLYRKIYETHGGLTIDVSHGDCRRAAVLAVAAHVRQGRCLVAQAVGRGVDVHVTEFVPNQWRVVVTDREATSKTAPCSAADAPATLARLLGEVGR